MNQIQKPRAVVYARVSSEKEMQVNAFENQLLWYDEMENRLSDRYDFVGNTVKNFT